MGHVQRAATVYFIFVSSLKMCRVYSQGPAAPNPPTTGDAVGVYKDHFVNGIRILYPHKQHPQLEGKPLGTTFPPREPIVGKAPTTSPDDPKEDAINHELKYAGVYIIQEHNPCEWFQERLSSKRNGKRSKGCRHEAERMMRWMTSAPLPSGPNNCQPLAEGRCFQFSGIGGRCYFRVNATGNAPGRWVLNTSCRGIALAQHTGTIPGMATPGF